MKKKTVMKSSKRYLTKQSNKQNQWHSSHLMIRMQPQSQSRKLIKKKG
jgi:hypothetical protein